MLQNWAVEGFFVCSAHQQALFQNNHLQNISELHICLHFGKLDAPCNELVRLVLVHDEQYWVGKQSFDRYILRRSFIKHHSASTRLLPRRVVIARFRRGLFRYSWVCHSSARRLKRHSSFNGDPTVQSNEIVQAGEGFVDAQADNYDVFWVLWRNIKHWKSTFSIPLHVRNSSHEPVRANQASNLLERWCQLPEIRRRFS